MMNIFKSLAAAGTAVLILGLLAVSPSLVSAQGPGVSPSWINAQGPGGWRPAFGSISAIDATGKTITVANDAAGDSSKVSVTSDTNIFTQASVNLNAVEVGDTIDVQGVPTGITASSITDGQNPMFGPRPGGSDGSSPGGPGAGGLTGPGGMPDQNVSFVRGTVKSLNPLTIALGDGAPIVVGGASDATVTKFMTLKFSDL